MNQGQFDEARHRIEQLIAQEENGEIDLYFFDESGFTIGEVIEKRIRQLYADWADQPLPALDGKTPREAI
ncbi:MAG: hypothetical protein ACFCVA_16575 [Gammaproteobacteria bacterium]